MPPDATTPPIEFARPGSLDLLVLGDMHYVGPDVTARTGSTLHFRFALELAVRAVRDALRAGRPDAIVLLGDIVDRGSAAGAIDDLRRVRDTLAAFDIPLIVAPGNHDDYPDQVQRIFDCPAGAHELGDYLLFTFAEGYAAETELPRRAAGQMAKLAKCGGQDRPIVVVQHPVVRPAIERSYPYNFPDADAIARAYADAGVCLSISGHYHAGLPLHVDGGVSYAVCPALSADPFVYTRIRLAGRAVASIQHVPLSLVQTPGLHDMHIHTDFAYCAEDITPGAALERMTLLGVPTAGLLEHAEQLYLPRDGYWKRCDTNCLAALREASAEGCSRHAEFRHHVLPLRGERVRLGLEVEPAADGPGLALLPGDGDHCDYLIGAVHHLGPRERMPLSPGEVEQAFLAAVRQLVESGVDILAHPFRYFTKKRRLPSPTHLYRPVVELLAAGGVAAEINFHTYTPDPAFYAMCLQRGVKLSLGTDAHGLVEVAELRPHLDLLAQLGVLGRLDEVLISQTP